MDQNGNQANNKGNVNKFILIGGIFAVCIFLATLILGGFLAFKLYSNDSEDETSNISVIEDISNTTDISKTTEFTNNPQEPPSCDNGGGYIGTLNDDTKKNKTIETSSEGRFYKKTSLIDKNINATVFSGLIPQDWQAELNSNWQIISTNYPALEIVSIVSNDRK
ncbi:hypothetical protein IJT10_02285, partial [bacterium]|nr:hypothetical protein [bacterium]